MNYLDLVGGKKISQEKGDSLISPTKAVNHSFKLPAHIKELETIEVEDWKNIHVLDWMKIATFKDNQSFFQAYGAIWKENNVLGKNLIKMKIDDLISIGAPENDANELNVSIQYLSNTKKFNYFEFKLVQKMFKFISNFSGWNDEDWISIAKSLASEEGLKKIMSADLDYDEIKKYIYEENLEEFENKFQLNQTPPIDEKIKIKITILDVNEKIKNVKNILCPLKIGLPSFENDFGEFRAGMIIGPWFLEWNESGIIYPRKLFGNLANQYSAVDNISIKKMSLDQASDTLVKVIAKWNTQMEYSNESQLENYKANSVDFIENVLEAFDKTIDNSGSLKTYIKKMNELGQCDMFFSPNEDFIEHFNLTESTYYFNTHQELDLFVQKLNMKDELSLYLDYYHEMILLKSFDLIFWFRHINDLENIQFKPLGIDNLRYPFISDREKCPFGDPREHKPIILNDDSKKESNDH